ncbi:MAG: hypothetical protein IH612_21100 [Desulfofustis sp.]|nr:hypothetical protein [Desulfofustis sp.]
MNQPLHIPGGAYRKPVSLDHRFAGDRQNIVRAQCGIVSAEHVHEKDLQLINGKITVLFREYFQLSVYFNIGAFLLVDIHLCQFSPYQGATVADDKTSPDLPHIISFISLAHGRSQNGP